jgi:SAM-dependent methyltransferase
MTRRLFNLSARFYNVLHLLSLANLNNEKAFETILTYCNIDNVSVLDIGCGTGIWSSFFLPHCSKIHGIDFSEKLLKKAKANIENPKISFELLSAFDIDKFPEKTFDIITASFFFHGLLSDERVEILHKVRNIGKRYLIVSDYGDKIPIIPKIMEFIEQSDYKNFISSFEKECSLVFGNVKKITLRKGGAVYISAIGYE